MKESLIQFLEKRHFQRKWDYYALRAFPYLLDCARKKKTITYSELGEILYKAGITDICYMGRRIAQYVGWIVGSIGEYCAENGFLPLNELVVCAGSGIAGTGGHFATENIITKRI